MEYAVRALAATLLLARRSECFERELHAHAHVLANVARVLPHAPTVVQCLAIARQFAGAPAVGAGGAGSSDAGPAGAVNLRGVIDTLCANETTVEQQLRAMERALAREGIRGHRSGSDDKQSMTIKHIAERLQTADPSLISLDLSQFRITYDDVGTLFHNIPRNDTLVELDLGDNMMHLWGGLYLFADLSTELRNLRRLHITLHSMYDDPNVYLITKLARNSKLEMLDLVSGSIDANLLFILSHARGIQELRLRKCCMDSSMAIVMADSFQKNRKLKRLVICDNNILDAGAMALADLLNPPNALSALIMRNNGFGHVGAAAVAEALPTNRTLTEIDLSENKISDEGATALARALRSNGHLQAITLAKCAINDTGAMQLCEALRENHAVSKLILDDNPVEDDGVVALGRMLEVNRTLRTVSINGWCYKRVGACSFFDSMRSNTGLTELSVNLTYIGPAAERIMADMLRTNTSLTKLDALDSVLSSGTRMITAALVENTTLTRLELGVTVTRLWENNHVLSPIRLITAVNRNARQYPYFTTGLRDALLFATRYPDVTRAFLLALLRQYRNGHAGECGAHPLLLYDLAEPICAAGGRLCVLDLLELVSKGYREQSAINRPT